MIIKRKSNIKKSQRYLVLLVERREVWQVVCRRWPEKKIEKK